MAMMHGALGDTALLRSLTSGLRRRVPSPDVEDVAQTVLCDALASDARAPSDPDELRKWLAGIARHKVADYHRRAKRLVLEEDCDGVAPAPPHEARRLLASVEASTTSPREREALGWLVREHGGEKLSDIAREEGLSGTLVRQRVSRLRRALRERLGALLVLGLLAGAGATVRSFEKPMAIVAEPSHETTRATLAAAHGDWTVAHVVVEGALSDLEKGVLERELAHADMHVTSEEVRVVTSSGRVERRAMRADGALVFRSEQASGGTPIRATMVLEPPRDGEADRAEVKAVAGRAQVRLTLIRH